VRSIITLGIAARGAADWTDGRRPNTRVVGGDLNAHTATNAPHKFDTYRVDMFTLSLIADQSIANITHIKRYRQLASRLINAQPLPAHRHAADDNSFIGCTRPQPDR